MAGEFRLKAPNITRQIFESHFGVAFNPEAYQRAETIFDRVGAFNERSIAIQFHVAAHVGKLEEVLSAYEKLMDPEEGFLHLIADPLVRAAEVRRFGDVIYSSVIAEGDPMSLLQVREEANIPKIFDLMGQ